MDDIVTADSIMEGYRHHGTLSPTMELADGSTLVFGRLVLDMVRPSPPGPSGPRRSPLAMVGKWLVIALLILTIFGFGFVAGPWQMDCERRPIEAAYRADIARLKQEFGQHELAMRMGAIGEIMQREELLGQAIQEIARLNGVNKWLQGKFQTSL